MLEGQRFEPAGRLAQFMRLLADVDRDTLAEVIERGIERLDQIDGDPDLEDGHDAEQIMALDGFIAPGVSAGLTDDHEPEGDAQGDRSWTEWHDRSPARQRALHETTGGVADSEDDEDDDPDRCEAGDDGCAPFIQPFTGRVAWGSRYDDDHLPWSSPTLGYAQAAANAA